MTGRQRASRLLRSTVTVAGAWLVTAALSTAPAEGYVRTRTQAGDAAYWNHPVVSLTMHTGQPAPGLTAEQMLRAAEAAAATWSRKQVSCSQLEVQVRAGGGPEVTSGADGHSRIIFRRDEWCPKPRTADTPCYDPGMLALTSVFMRKSDGQIVEADIELNAVATRWSDAEPDPELGSLGQDVQGTLTHELGHLLGFEHSCMLPGEETRLDDQGRPSPTCTLREDPRDTVMVASVPPGRPLPRALSADDARGVCAVYPLQGKVVAGDHAGCAAAGAPRGTGGGAAAGLLLLIGLVMIAAGRRFSGQAAGRPASRPAPARR